MEGMSMDRKDILTLRITCDGRAGSHKPGKYLGAFKWQAPYPGCRESGNEIGSWTGEGPGIVRRSGVAPFFSARTDFVRGAKHERYRVFCKQCRKQGVGTEVAIRSWDHEDPDLWSPLDMICWSAMVDSEMRTWNMEIRTLSAMLANFPRRDIRKEGFRGTVKEGMQRMMC